MSLSIARPGTMTAARTVPLGIAGVATLLAALPAFALLQYLLPDACRATVFGINHMGGWHFRDHLGLDALPTLPLELWTICFRLLVGALWAGYAAAIISGLRGQQFAPRPIFAAILGAAATMAVFCPPLLSSDLYAYLSYGRLAAIYGQNPYVTPQMYLVAVHDPVAPFLFWNLPDVYGPVWTRLSVALVALHPAGLWPEAVGMKLIEAAAVVTMALAGRGIAKHLAPGRENLTMLAIGLNPLLLIEGPGNGHNDLLLIAFFLLGAMFFLDGKYLLASLFLGLSVGIKLITLAALPWMLIAACRDRPGKEKLRLILSMTALTVLPTLLCYGRFWVGTATVAALGARAAWGLSLAAQEWRHGIIVVVYLALSVWVWRQRAVGTWLTAWSLLAAVLMFVAFDLPFPWYACWFLPILLTRWDRASLAFTAAACLLGLLWTCRYAALILL